MVQDGQTSPCFDADFYPFGGERDITATCAPVYKFEGKERDTETNNDDFGARYYSSRLGRWLSADWSAVPAPVPYANLTNPQTLNLYAMVSDNPETFADLDGHVGAQSSTSTVTQSWCGDKTCTTTNNAGTCTGQNCGSSNNDQQQKNQTTQPQQGPVLDGNLHVTHNSDGTTTSYQGTSTQNTTRDSQGNVTGSSTTTTVTTQQLNSHGDIVKTSTETTTTSFDASGRVSGMQVNTQGLQANSEQAQYMRDHSISLGQEKFVDVVPLPSKVNEKLASHYTATVSDFLKALRWLSPTASTDY
jgi:RHS repeat-associated protein